jgi:hypothetical protein
MNLDDLLKRVTKEDGRKMFIFRDKDGGWSNVNLTVKEHAITITLDDNEIFSDDK